VFLNCFIFLSFRCFLHIEYMVLLSQSVQCRCFSSPRQVEALRRENSKRKPVFAGGVPCATNKEYGFERRFCCLTGVALRRR